MADEPQRLILVCRVLPLKLRDGRAWPWINRKRSLFKALLRAWGLVIEDHTETPADKPSENGDGE